MIACVGTKGEEDQLGNRWAHRWTSNERKSRGLGDVQLTMLYIPLYTHERRPYSAT